MDKDDRIYVAGAGTVIGAAILRELERKGYQNIVGGKRDEPDLTDAAKVETFFAETTPSYVFLVAGKSGGIAANQKYPADLLLDNLLVECHVLQSAWRHGVRKLLYLASSCIYPRHCPQPTREEALLTGPLEPTNEAYAVAKIAGMKLCQAYRQQYGVHFISAIPASPFGPGDDFSLEDSHVIPALMRKMHAAKTLNAETVELWGSGNPRREFIFVDDLADACIFVMRRYNDPEPINLGHGMDFSVKELAELIKEIVGYSGHLRFDASKPDGMPSKVLDCTKLRAMGWRPKTSFRIALSKTLEAFLQIKEEGGDHVRPEVERGGIRDLPEAFPDTAVPRTNH